MRGTELCQFIVALTQVKVYEGIWYKLGIGDRGEAYRAESKGSAAMLALVGLFEEGLFEGSIKEDMVRFGGVIGLHGAGLARAQAWSHIDLTLIAKFNLISS